MTEKIMPHNIDIEESLISSILIKNELFDEIVELSGSDFYKKINGEIFNIINNLGKNKNPITITTIGEKFKDSNILSIEVVKHLSYLYEYAPFAVDVMSYSKAIKDYSTSRNIINSCMKIIDMGYSIKDPAEIIDYAQSNILDMDHAGSNDLFSTSEDLMMGAVDRIENNKNSGVKIGIDIGLPELRNRVVVHGSKLIFIAGRPGMGKTALMLAQAKHIAGNGIKTGIISIEMDNDELADRFLSSESCVNTLSFYNNRKLKTEEYDSIRTAAGNLSKLPIILNDSKASIQDVKRRCRKMKKQGCKIIFIDQLSKISFPRNLSEYEGYTRNCGHLAELKKELRMPIVVLCQLGRKVEETYDKKPKLSHLKQTGQIEEDADMVFFIYRPGYYGLKNNVKEDIPKSFTEIILAKVRNGIPGSDYSAFFDEKRGSFILNSKYGGL